VRAGLPAKWTVDELDAAIARVKAAVAEEEASRTVQGVRPLGGAGGFATAGGVGMQDSMDQISEALSALIESRPPKNGVRPLSASGRPTCCCRATTR